MGPRTRKAVASVAIMAFLGFYVWAAVTLSRFIPDRWWAQGLYFAVAGLGWGVPMFPVFRWAERGGGPRSEE